MSQAAQVLIALLPLISVIIVGILCFFYLLWEYRKAQLLIEKDRPLPPSRFNERLLLVGIVALCVGAGLSLYFLLKGGMSDALLGGIIPVTTGLGIIIYYRIVGGPHSAKSE
jgi:hypothetical protein